MTEKDNKITELYQQTKADGPDSRIDTAILAAAKREVASKPKAASPSSYRWIVPASLAAGLALIISIFTLNQPTIQPVDGQNGTTENNYASAPVIAAEKWLHKIATLVKEDKQSEAMAEYQAFRKAFPDAKIDYDRFSEIKQLDKLL